MAENTSNSTSALPSRFRLKRLHALVIRAYMGPFMVTFFVMLFLLLMQFLWKYIDDLVGKGLESSLVIELLLYASANLVPMALPLAILLSSIMTFGNLGERSELTAMKSAGMSLFKIMRPLLVVILFTALGAFGFTNYIWPKANLKFRSLLYDITEKKPTFNLKPGVFYNDIPGYSIRVMQEKADPDDPTLSTLHDVLIYDHTNREATNNRVTWAESGTLRRDSLGNLIFVLEKGVDYWEYFVRRSKAGDSDHPHIGGEFARREIYMDMTSFNMMRRDESIWEGNYEMLNLAQLRASEDTLRTKLGERREELKGFIDRSLHLHRDSMVKDWTNVTPTHRFFDSLSIADRTRAIEVAGNQIRNMQNFVETSIEDFAARESVIDRHRIEWHRKFTLSFACIILFFVGAPLGAIVRRGGLGMPVVFSVILFLIFHILTITGEKMAETEVMYPYSGMWLASAILFPLGLFLTYKAARDSTVITKSGFNKFVTVLLVIAMILIPIWGIIYLVHRRQKREQEREQRDRDIATISRAETLRKKSPEE